VTVSTETELRAALADPATTTVTLANPIDLTDCSPTGGDLDRSGALVLDGGDFTLRQTCAGERVLESTAGALTLHHLTVTGGDQTATADPSSDEGGGIRAVDDLVLDDTSVSDNSLSGFSAFGAGVHTDGTLFATDSTIVDNTATATGGTFAPAFGGGASSTNAQLDGTTVERNAIHATSDIGAASAVAKGGGVFAEESMRVSGSTIASNTIDVQGSAAAAEGGGLLTTDLTISSSTVRDNGISATGDPNGAGIASGGGVRAAGTLVVDDTTITRNTAVGLRVFGGGAEAEGSITVTMSRVDENIARSTGGSFGAGVLGGTGAGITITDSSVDGNAAETTDGTRQNVGADGGGIAMVASRDDNDAILDPDGTVTVVRSSVSENALRPVAAELALAVGGGIFADSVELESSHVDANELHPTATEDAAVGWGGGVWTDSSVTVVGSTVDRNVVDPDGVVEAADHGAAVSQHALTVTDSSASDNQVIAAGQSGFAECAGLAAPTVTASRSVVDSNQVSGTANAIGGGVCAGTATVGASTISHNTVTSANGVASGGGGTIGGGALRGSTVSGNSVDGTTAHGGGLVHRIFSSDAAAELLEVTNSTVVGNTASSTSSSSGGGIEQLHDPTLGNAGPLAIAFSTIATNTAGSGANIGNSADTDPVTSYASTISGPLGGGTNCAGVTLVDQGYTQVTDASCGTVASTAPQLGALADNGGPTLTMLPAETSPLLDQVPADACLARVTTDQRGVTRPQGTACDIGAVEVEVSPPPTPEPTPLPTAADGPTAAPAVVADPRFTG
jgi:hypothetical protein